MTHSLEPSNFPSVDAGPKTVWWWRLLDGEGRELPAARVATVGSESPEFPSQGDAETWVGEVWRDLLEDGVAAVTLLEGEREVYGPMPLTEG